MFQEVNRITPNLPAEQYQTYQITTPPDVLISTACENAGCLQWAYGWESHIDEATPLGQFQASHIRQKSGRTFREQRTAEGITVFRFEAHQRCFAEHQTRPEFYLVRGGDWRHYTDTIRQHSRPADWVEDFGEHQQRIADQTEKG